MQFEFSCEGSKHPAQERKVEHRHIAKNNYRKFAEELTFPYKMHLHLHQHTEACQTAQGEEVLDR